ncbi:unnamed protein product [Acanthosepion pharaonis]|uniref:Uncharacterized protein n=1 Tax=Acanthosepion pharaonis TaxID=158019 RepID=A0A812EET0_ACAPH|nr:unnamed protein product [Sepia pharaonis]
MNNPRNSVFSRKQTNTNPCPFPPYKHTHTHTFDICCIKAQNRHPPPPIHPIPPGCHSSLTAVIFKLLTIVRCGDPCHLSRRESSSSNRTTNLFPRSSCSRLRRLLSLSLSLSFSLSLSLSLSLSNTHTDTHLISPYFSFTIYPFISSHTHYL